MAIPRTRHTVAIACICLALAFALVVYIVYRQQRSRDEIFGGISSWAEVPIVGPSLNQWTIHDAQVSSSIGVWHHDYYVTGTTSVESLRQFEDSALIAELHHPVPDRMSLELIDAANALKMDDLATATFNRSDNYLLLAHIDEGFVEARFDPASGRFLASVKLWNDR